MFLKEKSNGRLVEVLGLNDLFNPMRSTVVGRYHAGEEVQDAESFAKGDLVFCSGETMPRCWTDVHYRDDEIQRR
ncbi:acetyltransferase [Thioalkalicoccus limnaeus]|uniref:Acetyltransferase n=1 Tax=Thioalkalicoccus limnaeus TaxID=120681 RepID=A0ABV4BGJ6_9GAMM